MKNDCVYEYRPIEPFELSDEKERMEKEQMGSKVQSTQIPDARADDNEDEDKATEELGECTDNGDGIEELGY